MVKIVLTDMTVQKLGPGTYFDSKTPAFGIRVGKNRRTWIATKGTDRKVITLGHYPSVSLQDARKKAYAAFLAPEAAKATITFPEALQAFLAQDRWRPQTKRVLTSNLNHFPWKGQLAKITHEQVLAALETIEGKSARWHARKDITTFFNWCIPRYLTTSPATGIRMPTQPTRERVLTDDELKAVWIASEQMGDYGLIIRVLLLSGQRRGEAAALKPSWLKDHVLTVPAEVAKNARQHSIPLGSHLSTLATTVATIRSSKEPFTAWSKSHKALLTLSRTSDWTPHDARRSFASNQARLGTPIHVIEKILNHTSGSLSGVAGIYNRYSYFEEMKLAMQKHEDWLLSIARQ